MEDDKPMTPERRRELIAARAKHYKGKMDFAPSSGFCRDGLSLYRSKRCDHDFVSALGDLYETKWITGCPECYLSYCE